MLWDDLYRQTLSLVPGYSAVADQRPFIYIDSVRQCLHCIDIEESESKTYPVSTAEKGLGNRLDSNKTPFGVHRIKQKIGGAQPKGMVFKGREPTGRISDEYDQRMIDEITSRILWLDGLEKGVNKGGDHDSYSRYIYIHGTSDEKRIGQAVSIGCIRMNNDDVIELFDNVLVNDLVIIR
ncbi:MAG: L,D-transpeptidase [Gammaproteobacteria bacterium]|nr:L,D-transpeptidase [Gammaproteobacteria bacterium]